VNSKIAITIGDPAGIGPEITLKALSVFPTQEIKFTIVGDRAVINEIIKMQGVDYLLENIQIIETDIIKSSNFPKNCPSTEGGLASSSYISKAVELALTGRVDALVTAPISKEALKMAGIRWHGHTEMLAELSNTSEYAMMLCGGPLRVILVTIHEAFKNVPSLITKEKILKTIILAEKASLMLNIEKPKIAVCALNPHAGEAGLFGVEEQDQIIPAIESAREKSIQVYGPYPADTIFYRAYKGEFDIIVCMYHDQGLIPLKMIAFESGVNVTVGIPFIRTSPDHGTAYDIAWKGIANPSSMIEAIKMAINLKVIR